MAPTPAPAADTEDVSKVGVAIDTCPTTVLEESELPGGWTKNNQPVGGSPAPRAKINPGLRGRK
jgi:hypothetical protein